MHYHGFTMLRQQVRFMVSIFYKDIWTLYAGEILCMEQETHNEKDHFAIPIVKAKTIAGHIPHTF